MTNSSFPGVTQLKTSSFKNRLRRVAKRLILTLRSSLQVAWSSADYPKQEFDNSGFFDLAKLQLNRRCTTKNGN